MDRKTKGTLIAVGVGIVAFLLAWGIVEAIVGFAFLLIKLLLAAVIAVVIGVAGLVLYNRLRPRD
jgi:hypothetical protein